MSCYAEQYGTLGCGAKRRESLEPLEERHSLAQPDTQSCDPENSRVNRGTNEHDE